MKISLVSVCCLLFLSGWLHYAHSRYGPLNHVCHPTFVVLFVHTASLFLFCISILSPSAFLLFCRRVFDYRGLVRFISMVPLSAVKSLIVSPFNFDILLLYLHKIRNVLIDPSYKNNRWIDAPNHNFWALANETTRWKSNRHIQYLESNDSIDVQANYAVKWCVTVTSVIEWYKIISFGSKCLCASFRVCIEFSLLFVCVFCWFT